MIDISWQIAALYATTCITLALAVLGRVYRGVPAANPFSLNYLLGAVWCLIYAIELQSPTLEQKLLLLKLRFFLLSAGPLVVVELTYRFIYGRSIFHGWKLVVGLLIPAATSILALSINQSPIFIYDVWLDTSGELALLRYKVGPWHWIILAYCYALIIYSIILLISSMIQAAPWARRARLLFLVGRITPLIFSACFYLKIIPPVGMNYAPISLGFTGILVAIAVFGDRMGTLTHVARYALVEKLNDLLIVLDPQHRVIDLNRAATRAFGLSVSQAKDRPIAELLQDFPEVINSLDAQADGPFEIVKEGQNYELTLIPVETNSKKKPATLLHFHNITRRKRAEDALITAKQVAEDADRAKSRYMAIMSHEIRSPLNSVLGFMGMLERTPLSAEQQEYLTHISHSGDSLLAIINEILDYSKVEAGKIQLVTAPFDLAAEIKVLCGTLKPEAERKSIDLAWTILPGTPSVFIGDKNRLVQILRNLITNAIKFTQVGQVSVLLECLNRTQVNGLEICELSCTVRDTGIGISTSGISRLFQPFSQVSRVTDLQYGGTGLGLVIARHLSELMGGTIQVHSTLGEGSTFTVTVKLQTGVDNIPAAQVKPSPALAPLLPLKILVVDDQAINRRLLQVMLTRMKHSVDLADSGASCLAMIKQTTFDLLVMDVEMPGLDGLETTRQIRRHEKEHPSARPLYIVALTAHAFADIREQCLAAGMDDYASKPITLSTLERTLQKFKVHS